MSFSYVRSSFLGGEWSKFGQGRYDLPTYPTALNVCLNSLPVESGQVVRRPGFRFICQTWLGHAGQLLSFAFKEIVPYTIEITAGVMRLIASSTAPSGFSAVTTNDSQSIVSISTANPAVVTTAGAHGWTSSQHVRFDDIGTSLLALQNRECAITVLSSTTFSLQDQVTNLGIDGSTLGAVPAGALVSRLFAVAAPWGAPGTATDLTLVRKAQAETTAVLFHPAVPPYSLTVTTPPGTATPAPSGPFAVFDLAKVSFTDGPYLDPYVGAILTPGSGSGSITLVYSGFGFPGFAATDVGRLIRIFCQPPQWTAGTYAAGNTVTMHDDIVNDPSDATYYQANKITSLGPPNLEPSDWTPVTGAVYAFWTWGTIATVNSSSSITATLQDDISVNPIYAWNLGAFGGTNGDPTCGVFHTGSGRLWMGGAIGNRFDACCSNGITVTSGVATINMAPTAADGTVGASNAITGVCNAEDANPILWMASHQQGVLAGTLSGEWLFFAPGSGSIAPNNIDVTRLTTIGGLNTEICYAEHTLVIVQKFGRKIVEYFADVFSGKFSAPSLTWLSKHLTKGGIQQIVYQQELVPTIWARVANALVGWVYKRESLASAQPPTISAGHRHTLGSGRTVESIATGPSTDGDTDSLMMISNDPVTGIRYVEALGDMPEEGDTLLDAQYLDSAIDAPFYPVPKTTNMPYGGIVCTGLFPLNGKTVTAWIAGLDCGDYVVANNQITVPFGDSISAGDGGGLFTAQYLNSLTDPPAWIGFTYTSQGQLVRQNAPQEAGSRAGPGFMKLRRHAYAAFQLEGAITGSISFGTDFSNLLPLNFTHDGGAPYTLLEQFTDTIRENPNDSDSFKSMLCWQVTRPYPCNIVAVGGALETADL